jgi:hypothetical protein
MPIAKTKRQRMQALALVCAFDPCRRSVARDDSPAGVARLDGELWGTPGSMPDVAIPDGSISLGGPIVTAVV